MTPSHRDDRLCMPIVGLILIISLFFVFGKGREISSQESLRRLENNEVLESYNFFIG
jgi:hypothetical protein